MRPNFEQTGFNSQIKNLTRKIRDNETSPELREKLKEEKRRLLSERKNNVIPFSKDRDLGSFEKSVKQYLSSLDGHSFARHFPMVLLLSVATIAAASFVVHQTKPLYEVVGFTTSYLAALGAILVAIGFACIHSVTKTRFSFLMCCLAVLYEVLFVSFATGNHENAVAKNISNKDPAYELALEKASIAKTEYEKVKSRYETPSSREYQNQWFANKYLKPAFSNFEQAQANLLSISTQLEQKNSNGVWISTLKLMYRLGLIILTMYLAHFLIDQTRKSFQFHL